VLHKPRVNPLPQRYQRGGIATICMDRRMKFTPITIRAKPSTMEFMVSRVQLRSNVCRIINMYRPGSKRAAKEFFSELENIIQKVQHAKEDTILIGDLNIAMNLKSSNAQQLTDLLRRCDLKQNVTCATHEKRGLLDLICCSNETAIRVKNVVRLPSDHCLLC